MIVRGESCHCRLQASMICRGGNICLHYAHGLTINCPLSWSPHPQPHSIIVIKSLISATFVVGGEGQEFGRRMSLSSSGDRKYGRAVDDTRHRPVLPVRHVPIVIESDHHHHHDSDNESDVTSSGGSGVLQYSGHTKLITEGPDRVPINYSWSIIYSDR